MLFDFLHIDIAHWVTTLGYIGLSLIILIETGFFFGFFLPGDSLVFVAGLLAAKGIFNLWTLVSLFIMTAILGYVIGYAFGHRLGIWLLKRKDSFWFKKKYIDQARVFFKRHGGKALVIARLVPVVRTFTPIVAGMTVMPYPRYCLYNVVGALLWAGGLPILGYALGSVMPNAQHYLFLAVGFIVFASLMPAIFHYLKPFILKKRSR